MVLSSELEKINSRNQSELLQFGCEGLLQDPDFKTLTEAIQTLKGGGRIVRLKKIIPKSTNMERITTTSW